MNRVGIVWRSVRGPPCSGRRSTPRNLVHGTPSAGSVAGARGTRPLAATSGTSSGLRFAMQRHPPLTTIRGSAAASGTRNSPAACSYRLPVACSSRALCGYDLRHKQRRGGLCLSASSCDLQRNMARRAVRPPAPALAVTAAPAAQRSLCMVARPPASARATLTIRWIAVHADCEDEACS